MQEWRSRYGRCGSCACVTLRSERASGTAVRRAGDARPPYFFLPRVFFRVSQNDRKPAAMKSAMRSFTAGKSSIGTARPKGGRCGRCAPANASGCPSRSDSPRRCPPRNVGQRLSRMSISLQHHRIEMLVEQRRAFRAYWPAARRRRHSSASPRRPRYRGRSRYPERRAARPPPSAFLPRVFSYCVERLHAAIAGDLGAPRKDRLEQRELVLEVIVHQRGMDADLERRRRAASRRRVHAWRREIPRRRGFVPAFRRAARPWCGLAFGT